MAPTSPLLFSLQEPDQESLCLCRLCHAAPGCLPSCPVPPTGQNPGHSILSFLKVEHLVTKEDFCGSMILCLALFICTGVNSLILSLSPSEPVLPPSCKIDLSLEISQIKHHVPSRVGSLHGSQGASVSKKKTNSAFLLGTLLTHSHEAVPLGLKLMEDLLHAAHGRVTRQCERNRGNNPSRAELLR